MIFNHITEAIGNTPIVKLDQNKIFNKNLNIYAKLEYLNPFGSLKDRIAWEMLKEEINQIKKEKKTIIENSSGNTAKALSILANIYGVNFKIITNRIKYQEKKDILKITKTEIKELPGKSQCLDPTDPYDPQFFIEKEIKKNPDKFYFTNQYFNENNFKAHLKTAKEIKKDLNENIDYFVSGVGTAGSTLGIKKYFKNKIKVIGVISKKGETIPGIRNEKELFSVGLFDKNNLDQMVAISEEEAVKATLDLIWNFGIVTGPTGGASYAAIKKIFKNEKRRLSIVFLACDRFEFYLSYFKKIKPDIFEKEIKTFDKKIKNITDEGKLQIDKN
ncbi:MAG: PLP-dependent cysteine synthase family protein [Microgenomates group bacterium]